MLFLDNVCKKVVTLFRTLRLSLLIIKAVKDGKFHTYWLLRRHVIIASIDPFIKQICATCEGHHKTRQCISNEGWKISNTQIKVSCWADDVCNMCEECKQQQLIIRSGNSKVMFKVFIHWLLRDKMNGFALVAHNGAGFDNHYLFHYLTTDFGLTVDLIYGGSKLLQFTVKKSAKDKDFDLRHRQCTVLCGTIEIAT